MLNLVCVEGKKLKEAAFQFQIALLDGRMFEADSLHELVAAVCGIEYLDCDSAETRLHMRVDAAKQLGLMVMTMEELEAGVEDDSESIIIYDERIGKIPYSYTDPVVDYEIHGEPELIRVECDETFLYSLEKARLIAMWEKIDGEYQRYLKIKDLNAEIEALLPPFREAAEKQGRVPLHKKLGK